MIINKYQIPVFQTVPQSPNQALPWTVTVAVLSAILLYNGTGGCTTPQSISKLPPYVRFSSENPEVVKSHFSSPSESLSIIRDVLLLNMSELASIFGVSRPTIYAWFEERQEPRHEVLIRIQQLLTLAEEVKQYNIPRLEKFIHRPIFSGESFLDKLKSKEDPKKFLSVIKDFAEKEKLERLKIKGSGKNVRPISDVLNEYSSPFYKHWD